MTSSEAPIGIELRLLPLKCTHKLVSESRQVCDPEQHDANQGYSRTRGTTIPINFLGDEVYRCVVDYLSGITP
jgi:hypothetical protein